MESLLSHSLIVLGLGILQLKMPITKFRNDCGTEVTERKKTSKNPTWHFHLKIAESCMDDLRTKTAVNFFCLFYQGVQISGLSNILPLIGPDFLLLVLNFLPVKNYLRRIFFRVFPPFLSDPLNRFNATLSLRNPLDCSRTLSAIGNAIVRPYFALCLVHAKVRSLDRLVLNRLVAL